MTRKAADLKGGGPRYLLHQPFARGIQLFQRATPSPSREEPTVARALTTAARCSDGLRAAKNTLIGSH
jgi:hypothetical protein